MWSKPSTDMEQRYYSKHSKKRAIYGIAQTAFQICHIALAMVAWKQIYEWAFRSMPSAHFLAIPLATISLVILHLLFRTTWETFWYDRLDNNDQTDSSPFLPIAIILLLLVTEQRGATLFLQGAVTKAELADDTNVLQKTDAQTAQINEQYQSAVSAINAAYAPRIASAGAKYEREIRLWQNKSTISDNDVAFKQRNIRAFEVKKAAATAQVQLELSKKLEALQDERTAQLKELHGRKSTLLTSLDNSNKTETQRYQSEVTQAGAMAWVISAFLVFAIAVLGYARVRINVRSGILPVRTFTDLDVHGSAIERIWVAVSDAMNRRITQLATWMHEKLSPSGTIRTIDGTVITAPGDYNQSKTAHNLVKPKPEAKAPPVEANYHPISDELKQAKLALTIALANFNDATTPDKKIETWNEIYNTRSELCAKSIASEITPGMVKVWFEKISFSEMIKRHPFPPATAPKIEAAPVPQMQDLPKATEQDTAPFEQTALPEGATLQSDGSILFKQSLSLFKQVTNGQGKVIGLKYKGPRSQDWTSLGYAQVKSYFETYKKRYENTSSEANVNGYDQWTWALGLFGSENQNGNDITKPITL